MKHIHKILSVFRFCQHGTFIVLSFILFDIDHENVHKNDIFGFKIYISFSFVIVFVLYYYIVVYWKDDVFEDGALQEDPSSTNRTLRQLLELDLYDEIVQMRIFGFFHRSQNWTEVMKDQAVDNEKIVRALCAFISYDVIEVDDIFSFITSHVNTQDELGQTVLHGAAGKYGNAECVSKFLKHNADPNVKNKYGMTPLHFAVGCSNGPDRLSKLTLLLTANADVNAREYQQGRTSLHYVANDISGIDCMDILLGVNNINVNATDIAGKTALDYALSTETKSQTATKNTQIIIKMSDKLLSAGGQRGS